MKDNGKNLRTDKYAMNGKTAAVTAAAGRLRAKEAAEIVPLLTPVNLALTFALAITVIAAVLVTFFNVHSAHVIGNTIYTNDEMTEYVQCGAFGENTFALSLLYHNRSVDDLAFVESIDIQMLSPVEINIIVKEKKLTGYINAGDSNIYVDEAGYVVERSMKTIYGVPRIDGLEVEEAVKGEKLVVDNPFGLSAALNALYTMKKYDISVSNLSADPSASVTIDLGEISVVLGQDENYDLKLSRLAGLMPELEGRSGIINLMTYTSEKNIMILQKKR